jgi:hypothetical protein
VRRLTVLLTCLAIAAAGCVQAAATMAPSQLPATLGPSEAAVSPSKQPATVIPSKACGGYHLVIENATRSEIAVSFNKQPVITIQPGQTADIAQWGNYPVPLMPWDVVAGRVADGVVLLQMHVEDDSTDGQRVRVEDIPDQVAAVSPYIC